MTQKSKVAVVDFKNPRDAQGNIVLHPSIQARAKEIADQEYNAALKVILERAEKVIWPD